MTSALTLPNQVVREAVRHGFVRLLNVPLWNVGDSKLMPEDQLPRYLEAIGETTIWFSLKRPVSGTVKRMWVMNTFVAPFLHPLIQGHIACPCGSPPNSIYSPEQGVVPCTCGALYTWDGWILLPSPFEDEGPTEPFTDEDLAQMTDPAMFERYMWMYYPEIFLKEIGAIP